MLADMQKRSKSTDSRTATVKRRTKETKISATVDLDGTGAYDVSTGVGFLDHMIEQLARHSLIDIALKAEGDLHIDQHHTVEDSGIVLGQALAEALGDKAGITRYGACYLPMRWTPNCFASGSRPSPSTQGSRCTWRLSTARIVTISPRPAIRRSPGRCARRSPSIQGKADGCPPPRASSNIPVIAELDPAILAIGVAICFDVAAWMPGSSPGMTM